MKIKNFFCDLKNGIINIFKGKAQEENLFSLDGRVPLKKAIPFGIQHILSMFVANITPIIIVFAFIENADPNFPLDFKVNAMLGALFMAGLGTIIQLFIGSRLPVVIGTSFTFVAVFISIANGVISKGGSGIDAFYTIMGSILVGGVFTTFLGVFFKYWSKIIKPIVPAIVVLSIGMSLLSTGATQFVGGTNVLQTISNGSSSTVPYYAYILVALATLIISILWNITVKGVWKNINIIVGILGGYLIALLVPGMIDFSGVSVTSFSDIMNYPHFVNISKFIFKLEPILLTCVCFIVSSVESNGDTSALTKTGLGRDVTNREVAMTLGFDGFSSSFGSCFGALPLTTFSQNVGIVAQTKVVNRFTIFLGACFLILVSFFPQVANILYTIPDSVIGGTMVILFGSIAVIGMKMVGECGWTDKNIIIISICMCLGFGITTSSDFMNALRAINLDWLANILSNCSLNMFIIGVILSWVLPDSMQIFRKKKTT